MKDIAKQLEEGRLERSYSDGYRDGEQAAQRKYQDEIDRLKDEIQKLKIDQSNTFCTALLAAAKGLMENIKELAAESEGVAGLHLNGDLAEWESLLPGGKFESWLGEGMTELKQAIYKAEKVKSKLS